MKEVDASLKRLQTDTIDLYQAHRDDPDTPQEETRRRSPIWEARQGAGDRRIELHRGPTEVGARGQQAHGLPRYESLQPLYNLVERPAFETELEPLCQAEDLGVINYYALAAGFLTGKYRSEADLNKSPRGGGVKKYLNGPGLRVLQSLDDWRRT